MASEQRAILDLGAALGCPCCVPEWPAAPTEPDERYLAAGSEAWWNLRKQGYEAQVLFGSVDVTNDCVAVLAGPDGWAWCYGEEKRREWCPCGCGKHAYGMLYRGHIQLSLSARSS
jgi:hypothetical protein